MRNAKFSILILVFATLFFGCERKIEPKKSEFEVTATLDVKGVALDPNDIVEVRMIG